MQNPRSPGASKFQSGGLQSVSNRRMNTGGKETMAKEEKVYREIMGADGKVKNQYAHWLIDLEIDSEDILDK